MPRRMTGAHIGTSGWTYREWRGDFYPREVPLKKWLPYYASQFDSVEVNYSFYRLPTEQTCEAWYRETPDQFRFALKASRYLTHIKRIRDAHEAWDTFIGRVSILKHKLGPILLQFSSTFSASDVNLKSLDDFLDFAGRGDRRQRLAVEFRSDSCFGNAMLALLRRHRAALVISHSTRYPVPDIATTADFTYFRFHGPRKMFASSYSKPELCRWADQMRTLLRQRREVYAYFNNDWTTADSTFSQLQKYSPDSRDT